MDCRPVFENAGKAARSLASADGSLINIILERLADYTEERIPFIIENNAKDLARMDKADPRYDRLQLTPQRIKGIASDIRNVAALPSPLGRELYRFDKPDGMIIRKVSVPFGVIGIIYEARPNVTFDVFALCIKSGNATVLKGGSDAIDSNTAITDIIREVLKEYGLDENLISLLPPGREETIQLLNARNYVDLIIPRGSQGLIDYVRKNATIPVIETGAGICHTYFDEFGNTELGQKVIHNAKTRRVSVCNALDCLVIHEKRIQDLCQLVSACAGSEVVIYADPDSYAALSGRYPAKLLMPATEESFGTEFLSYKMAIKTVRSFDEAVEHIRRYSSKHSEAIISEDPQRLELFFRITDAAAVYTNTSTAFTDGAEFGLGAEIGISTQKLHARGPMGLKELTTYKWLIEGRGQTRS